MVMMMMMMMMIVYWRLGAWILYTNVKIDTFSKILAQMWLKYWNVVEEINIVICCVWLSRLHCLHVCKSCQDMLQLIQRWVCYGEWLNVTEWLMFNYLVSSCMWVSCVMVVYLDAALSYIAIPFSTSSVGKPWNIVSLVAFCVGYVIWHVC